MIDAWGIKTGLLLSAFALMAMTKGMFPFERSNSIMVEDCTNGLDDDRDGWTDLNDPDCICSKPTPISLIPNPSFEEQTCCPVNRSQLNCANGWIQASDATTDYLHTCGWLGPEEFKVPLPPPDGNGFVGLRDGRVTQGNTKEVGWKEYAGACLLSPMKANTTYRFEFYLGFSTPERSPSIEISFFGTQDCSFLPFGRGNEQFGCPTNSTNWEYLASQYVESGRGTRWVKTLIEITPRRDMKAVAIGPSCTPSNNDLSTYYYFDNLVLADLKSFAPTISLIGHPCNKQFGLLLANRTGVDIQWYKNGVALVGEKGQELRNMDGEGRYQVRVMEQGICLVSEAYDFKIPVIEQTINLTICNGEVYKFGNQTLTTNGNYTKLFKSVNECDSTVHLNFTILEELSDTISVKILKGDAYLLEQYEFADEGRNYATVQNKIGCDSLVVVDLEYLKIWLPNIINTHSDGKNRVFKPVFEEEEIASIEFKFYDRWGNLVHEGSDWDGNNQGRPSVQGVYIYSGLVTLPSGHSRMINGDLLVLW